MSELAYLPDKSGELAPARLFPVNFLESFLTAISEAWRCAIAVKAKRLTMNNQQLTNPCREQ